MNAPLFPLAQALLVSPSSRSPGVPSLLGSSHDGLLEASFSAIEDAVPARSSTDNQSCSETPDVSSGMKSCRLTLKACKQVIHAVRSISPDYDTLREETQAVLACALVCRDWREVSQSVLWEAVAVRTDEQIERLIQAFGRKTSSEQGDPPKVYTLCTSQSNSGIRLRAASGENDAASTERPRGTQANPATTKLRDLLVKLGSTDLRTLDLNAVIWTEWPIRLDQFWQWPFAQSLEELRLNGCAFVKADDLIDIAWACAKLQRLVIRQSDIRENCHKMGKYSKGRPGSCKTHAPTGSSLQRVSGLPGSAAGPPQCTCKLTELKELHLSVREATTI